MAIVLKAFRYLFILTCLLVQACQSHVEEENKNESTIKRTDLSKAAAFNTQLGLGYLKQGNRPRAKRKLLTALKQQPESPDVNAAMAYYFEQTNELDKAKTYYLKAVSLSSNGGSQLNNYGTFLCRQGDYAKAETYFLKAVQDQQYLHTAGAYENAGLCALAIPDNDKAKLYFTKALSQDPSRKPSLFELVKLESSMGRDVEALELLKNHAELVLSDKIMITLAKDVANKAGQMSLAAEYEHSLNNTDQHVNNSGADDEYNSHNG